ncbi:MAG: Hint domain-containing protein [Rhodobacteraceae bacterium]|nr:Hint domain-containing protein [Paracoccaceae bacterium]MCF8513649.1 Hint domain-containing protein [Paracoccaceae bacterium]MCF8517451.1 Hint domain-containing protein [Paracoccaceae bacterium]
MFLKDFTRTAAPASITTIIPAPAMTGLSSGCLVDTPKGWVAAADLRIGMRVHSLDGGEVMILGLDRTPVVRQPAVVIGGGVAGNCADLLMPLGQHLLVDTLDDPNFPDAEVVLVPAEAWLGQPGTCEMTMTDELTTPLFADEEILWVNSGTLIHCPSVAFGAGLVPDSPFFDRLSLDAARAFLTRRAARLAACA